MKRGITKSGVSVGAFLALAAWVGCGGQSGKPAEAPPSAGPDAPTPGESVAQSSSEDVRQGVAALQAGDVNGARASFEVAIQKNPRQADAYHYLGLVQEQTGQKDEAERSYRKALELSPDLEESAINLAAILVESGKFGEAARLMKSAAEKNPKSAALQVNLAMALAGEGDVAAANRAFEEAIRLEPNNAIYLVTYASHLAANKQQADAAAKLKEAEKVAASDAGVLASVALEYRGMGDFKTCVAVLDKAVALQDVAELRVYRGACKLGLKDLPGATTEFKDAVAKEPNNALARYSLGNALADGGKLTEAIAEWEACLRLAPDGPQAKAAERKIAIAQKKAGKKK